MSTHTPGPWTTGTDNVVYDERHRDPICDCSFRSEDVSSANAKLISSAPNLLLALEQLLSKAYKQNFNDAYPEAVKDAEDAIDRAKGET